MCVHRAAFHLRTYGFSSIEASSAKQHVLLYPSTGAPPTWRYSIRPIPAATCSSCRCLPYHPFGGHWTPFARAKPIAPPQDLRSAIHGTMGVVPAASLNANNITNATGVMAQQSATVSTAPPLPPTVVLTPVPPCAGAYLTPASCPPSIAPGSTFSPLSSVSSPSSGAGLNSTVVVLLLLVSSSRASSRPSALLVNSTSPLTPVPVPSVPHLPSAAPLSVSALTSELKGDPPTSFCQYLLSGFRHGFQIGFNLSRITRLQSASQNMQSALQNPQVVGKYLSREVHLGRVAGLFPQPPSSSPYQQIWCNPQTWKTGQVGSYHGSLAPCRIQRQRRHQWR